MKRKRVFSLLLCLCLVLTLLPTAALANGTTPATVKYINAADNEGTTEYSFADAKSDSTVAIFVNGGTAADTTYTYTTAANDADLLLLVSNAAVTVDENMPSEFRLAGTGSLTKSGVMATVGSYATPFSGSPENISNVAEFFTSDDITNAVYSYAVAESTSLSDFLTAYDLTVSSGKTLTINAPTASEPDHYKLTVTHALTVNGTLTAAAGQVLEICENAAVSGTGLTLYYSDGTHTYTVPAAKGVEFTYLDGKWKSAETAPAYTLAASAGEHGAITETATVTQGDSKAFAVTADSGYVISTLTVDGSSVPAAANQSTYTYTFSNVTAAHTIAATFIQVHTITASAGENGSISPAGSVTVAEGADQVFSFMPSSGYSVASITVDGHAGSGDSSYTFTNVTSDHAISVSFAEDNGGTPPAGTPDYEAAQTRLEGRHWAYGGDRGAVFAGFKEELWDLMSHEFAGTFADETACYAAVTMSARTTDATDDFTGHSYYTASVTLFDDTTQANDITVSLRVYVLSGTAECVVKYGTAFLVLSADTADAAGLTVTKKTQGGTASLSDVQLIIGDVDPDAVEIFGNGVMANTLAASGHHAAWHITPPPSLMSLSKLNFVLAVYNKDFLGAKLISSDDGGTAAAWDGMGQYPVVPLSFTDEWSVFFGNSSVTISSMALSSLGTVTGVAPADGSPAAAAAITSNGNGTWTVTFGSAFYDEVPLTITVNGTAYSLTIRRVGIGIQGIGRGQGDDSCTINQGTQPGSTLTWAEGDQYAVVATFYYPKSMFSSKKSGTAVDDGFGGSYYPWEYTIPHRVSLVVNYAYRDGRTETKIVDTGVRTADSYGYFVPADDFILYKGTRANAPASVCVTAILTSSGTAFGGAKLGSGAGVSWTRRADA